ncbi:MAG: polysaccharide biosynthesis tyrosine autokinase [Deltaproteobacteria bacterium]|nr:polysaccharide biosynthesis tyrosine autokinase [Deltaproteobacteria bacterium]
MARTPSNVVVWSLVRKYWPTALGTMLAVFAAATFYTLGQTKIYEAQATVMFNPNPPRPLGRRVESVVDMGTSNYWNNREYYETQCKIIQSMHVALATVQELGLQRDGGFLANLPEGVEATAESRRPVEPELAAETLRSRLRVQGVRDSRLATVRLEDASPQRAQRVLAVLVRVYVDQNLEQVMASTSQATEWLSGQLDKLKSELRTSELALHEYKKEKDILSVDFAERSNMLREEMGYINAEITRVRAQQQHVVARKAELDRLRVEDPTKLPATELLQSIVLQKLREDYVQGVRERDALLGAGKGESYPEVAAASRRVDVARQAILQEVENIRGALDRDVAVVRRQIGGLAGMYSQAKRRAHELNLLEIEYNRLHRSKENTEKLYSLVLERTTESSLTQMLRVNNIQVVDRPLLPRSAIRPQVPVNLGVGALVGIALGVVAAFVRRMLDRTINTPDDLENELGLTFLGLLPDMGESADSYGHYYKYQRFRRRGARPKIETPELLVHEQPSSGVAEASRAIRTNLMFMAPDKPHKTVLVTSAGPGEGKTTVACCIAIAMAQAGQRVVLVDGDLRRPRMHRIFGKSAEQGLSTAVLEGGLDDVLLETEIDNLMVVPAGPVPPNPAELFHSDRFKRFLAQLGERFDRVIIDSSPVVAVTDAVIVSTLVDTTLLVVRAFSTKKELAHHGLRSLQDVGGKVAGAVLNAVSFRRHEYRYSYYYYRRYEGYGSHPPRGSTGADTPVPEREHRDMG